MHAMNIEGMEFATYQLKDVVYQWYKEWDPKKGNDVESYYGKSFLILY